METITTKLLADEILTKVKALCYSKIDKGSKDTITKLLSDSFEEILVAGKVCEVKSKGSTIGSIDKSQVMFEVEEGIVFSISINEDQNENED